MKIFAPIKNLAETRISQKYGYTDFSQKKPYPYGLDTNGKPRPHNGVDFAIQTGTPIFSPFDGVARFSDSATGYGKHFKIRSSELGLECVLAHCSSSLFSGEKTVKKGDLLGYSGSTGASTGPHLHFGVRELFKSVVEDVFFWGVKNIGDSFYGYIDPMSFEFEEKIQIQVKPKDLHLAGQIRRLAVNFGKAKIYEEKRNISKKIYEKSLKLAELF